VRPISNVVDVTNWLLLEYGQPLHAFDYAAIRGRKIVVRSAASEEKMMTLDGVERTLSADDLVIADAVGASALAGVMGGQVSEVSSVTKDVVLEAAYFAPRGIRRTARRQSMHTESSHRFERGVDHGATEVVLHRARRLLREWCGGRVAPGIITVHGDAIPLPEIEFRGERMDQLLGVDVPFREATRVLSRLGFQIEYARDTKTGQTALIRGASHRPDVSIEADLIEEVARIRGLDNIPTVLPSIPPQEPRTSGRLDRSVAGIAVALGLSEALTYAFVSPKDLEALRAPRSVVALENPLTEERSVLRTTLLPGLLEALRRARRRGQSDVRLFSIGSVFHPPKTPHRASEARPSRSEDATHLPYEEPRFACVLAGSRFEHLKTKPEEVDLYDAKGIATELVSRLTGRSELALVSAAGDDAARHLHPRGAARIVLDGTHLGYLGPLHPDVIDELDLDGSAIVLELSLPAIEALGERVPKYKSLPKLPAIERDLSFVVNESEQAASVAEAIRQSAGELCESVSIVAEFRGGSVPKGQRSLTFRVTYRDPLARTNKDGARTLTDKEVDAVQENVLRTTATRFGATLRA
jgi:phenylalanyl-tRNA synthetase beta chain